MGIMRRVIDWCDDKMHDAYMEDNDRKACGKAFVSGAVEGFCDAAIIMYVPLVIGCFIYKKMLAEKE